MHRFGVITHIRKKMSKGYLKRKIEQEGYLINQRILSPEILDANNDCIIYYIIIYEVLKY